MASNSMIKVTATLALIVAQCQMILDKKRPDKLTEKKLIAIANHSIAVVRSWSGSGVSQQEMKKIGWMLNSFEGHFPETKTYFSFCLGLIDDIFEHVDGWKADNLKELRGKMLEAYEWYDTANKDLPAMSTKQAVIVYESGLLRCELMGN